MGKRVFAVLAAYAGIVLVNLAIWGLVVYAAVHFVRKFW